MPNKEGKHVLGVANDAESNVIKILLRVLLIIPYICLAGGLCLAFFFFLVFGPCILKSAPQTSLPKT